MPGLGKTPLCPSGPHNLSQQRGHTSGHRACAHQPTQASLLCARPAGRRRPTLLALGPLRGPPLARTRSRGASGGRGPRRRPGGGSSSLTCPGSSEARSRSPSVRFACQEAARGAWVSAGAPRPGLLARGCSEGECVCEVGLPPTGGGRGLQPVMHSAHLTDPLPGPVFGWESCPEALGQQRAGLVSQHSPGVEGGGLLLGRSPARVNEIPHHRPVNGDTGPRGAACSAGVTTQECLRALPRPLPKERHAGSRRAGPGAALQAEGAAGGRLPSYTSVTRQGHSGSPGVLGGCSTLPSDPPTQGPPRVSAPA